MHSYRSKVYAILNVLLFLSEYSKCVSLPMTNKLTIYCDNEAIITKVENIRSNAKYYDLNYNMSQHDAIIAIKTHLLNPIGNNPPSQLSTQKIEQKSVISSPKIKPTSRHCWNKVRKNPIKHPHTIYSYIGIF